MGFNGVLWWLNGIFHGIYWDIPSGTRNLLHSELENGHWNSGFTQLKNGDFPVRCVNVYQRVVALVNVSPRFFPGFPGADVCSSMGQDGQASPCGGDLWTMTKIHEENDEDSGVEPLNMWIYDGF